MNTNLKKAFFKIIFLLFFLYGYVAHAGGPCPPDDPDPLNPCEAAPGDNLPINENITILILIAVLFGIYIIYNNKLNKKRPI